MVAFLLFLLIPAVALVLMLWVHAKEIEGEMDARTQSVKTLYYIATWETDDLSSDAQAHLWEAVRDAHNFPKGGTSK